MYNIMYKPSSNFLTLDKAGFFVLTSCRPDEEDGPEDEKAQGGDRTWHLSQGVCVCERESVLYGVDLTTIGGQDRRLFRAVFSISSAQDLSLVAQGCAHLFLRLALASSPLINSQCDESPLALPPKKGEGGGDGKKVLTIFVPFL